MVENLKLQNKTISSSDSNLPSGKTVTVPASSTANWCTDTTQACFERLLTLDATDTSIPDQSSAQSNYGVYYNWYTATATYGTYEMNSGDVSYSICPNGWRLPTGGSTGEFKTLNDKYNSSALMRGVPAFVLSGTRYGSNATSNQGDNGAYWSSTARVGSYAYELGLGSSYDGPSDYYYKYSGYSVRCLAREP